MHCSSRTNNRGTDEPDGPRRTGIASSLAPWHAWGVGTLTSCLLCLANAAGVAVPTDQSPTMELDIPDERVNLQDGRLEMRLSAPADRCHLTVHYDRGSPSEQETAFHGAAAGTWLTLGWPTRTDGAVVIKMEVQCWSTAGGKRSLALFPWWLEVPHEEVIFSKGSAVIPEGENHKLDQAYQLIAEAIAQYGKILTLKLFVSGHTDTVGQAGANLSLSLHRAQAMAEYFRARGVSVPILFAGFGEDHSAVPTADGVDEPRNRRARFVVAVIEPNAGAWIELPPASTSIAPGTW